ncbi:phenoloxidase-activating factor 2-like [Planococcus citri]|uniref:phenoloxidase-activating factor 2-like n=1 Tax=Planococcus citri TaxID=170843 RepID=UPI0031F88F7F
MCRRDFHLLILVLVSSILIDGAITRTATTGRSRLSNQPWAASPLLRNNFDDEGAGDQQACQCVLFYICEEATTVKNDTTCEEPLICCKTETKVISEDDTFTPAPESPESSSLASSTSTESFIDSNVPSTSSSTSTPSTESAECGIRRQNGLNEDSTGNASIDALFGEFPWMAAILRTSESSTDNTLICGASILSPYIVLTAAHCINNIDISTLRVRAGDFIINGESDERLPHQDRTVNNILIHSNHSRKVLHNDLALITVNEPFTYGDHISSVCTSINDISYATSSSYDPENCLVTGWTSVTDNTAQNKLRRVSASIMSTESCENNLRETRLGRTFKLHPSFLCAKEEQSVCKGHGGGPLVCVSRSNPNKYVQVGVVSWGVGCDRNLPGVYASLENNSEWLTTEFNNLNANRQV